MTSRSALRSSSPPQAQDIAIGTLKLRAERQHAQRVLSGLLACDFQAARPGQWLFVRELNLSSQSTRMRTEFNQALAHSSAQAIDGRLAAARQANVVSFDSLPTLLMELLNDLACRQAQERWYWNDWAHLFNDEHSVARVLWQYHTHLAALFCGLSQAHRLAPILAQITDQAADCIADKVLESLKPDIQTSISSGSLPPLAKTQIMRVLQAQDKQTWVSQITNLPTDSPRMRLVVLAFGLSVLPALISHSPNEVSQIISDYLLQKNPSLEASNQLNNTVKTAQHAGMQSSVKPPKPEIDNSAQSPPVKTTRAKQEARLEATRSVNPDNAPGTTRNTDKAVSKPRSLTPEALKKPLPQAQPEATPNPNRSNYFSEQQDLNAPSDQPSSHGKLTQTQQDQPLQSNPAHNAEPFATSAEFYTHGGGFFYLINALRLLPDWEEQCSAINQGWHLLFDLSRLLGFEADITLRQFLATQLSLTDSQALEQLPPLPQSEPLHTRLSENLSKLWQPTLLERRALVCFTPSHIDVYLSLKDVQVPVRLAGLDVDPGWQRWLGRVIAFHYVEGNLGLEDNLGQKDNDASADSYSQGENQA